MKKTLLTLLVVLISALPTISQDTSKTVLNLSEQQKRVLKTLLTPEQTKLFNKFDSLDITMIQGADSAHQTAQNKYADVGRGIGIAVNESLGAINKQAAAFAETKVGKLTMLIVAWKVLGEDVKGFTQAVFGFAIGVPLLATFILVWMWHWKRTTTKRRYVVEEDGRKKKYSYEDTWFTRTDSHIDGSSDSPSSATVYVIAWWVSFCIGMIWITAGVIF